jgi:hypothetical protein
LSTTEFKPWEKIHRLNRQTCITEKIDGTNGVIYIDENNGVFAGSRNRWITPEDDNAGFARWVQEHKEDLKGLGPGYHYGEWWGQGIQRGYGLKEKRFSLFNADRWAKDRPACCHVVPVLAWVPSLASKDLIEHVLQDLFTNGSAAAPGFMRPEGIVLFHTASREMFKVTLEKDAGGKDA